MVIVIEVYRLWAHEDHDNGNNQPALFVKLGWQDVCNSKSEDSPSCERCKTKHEMHPSQPWPVNLTKIWPTFIKSTQYILLHLDQQRCNRFSPLYFQNVEFSCACPRASLRRRVECGMVMEAEIGGGAGVRSDALLAFWIKFDSADM
jgi:hypothetical protein